MVAAVGFATLSDVLALPVTFFLGTGGRSCAPVFTGEPNSLGLELVNTSSGVACEILSLTPLGESEARLNPLRNVMGRGGAVGLRVRAAS